MARTKDFDPDAVLEIAMETFWARGYEATSTQDLVEALGINKSSLYATFGSKDQLYRQALALYASRSGLAGLAGEGPLKPRLRAALGRLVEDNLKPASSWGCFAGNAAAERAPQNKRIRTLVGSSFDAVRKALAIEIIEAQSRNEIDPEVDPWAVSGSLLVMIEGLHIVAKGTRDRSLASHAIEAAIGMI